MKNLKRGAAIGLILSLLFMNVAVWGKEGSVVETVMQEASMEEESAAESAVTEENSTAEENSVVEESTSEEEASAEEELEGDLAEESEEELEEESEEELEEAIELYAIGANQADMRLGKVEGSGFTMKAGKHAGTNAEIYYAAKYSGAVISSGGTTLPRGHITYCIEPSKTMLGNNGYVTGGTFGSKDTLKNMTTRLIKEKGKLFTALGRVLAVCGPEMVDGPNLCYNPAQATRYLAAQVIIWKLVLGDLDENFNTPGTAYWKDGGYDYESMERWNTAPAGGRSIKSWYDEWIGVLKQSKQLPSFCSSGASPEYVMDGDELKLQDTNGIIGKMEITSSNSQVKWNVKGNELTIYNPEHVDFQLTFRNPLCKGAKEPIPILAVDTTNQNKRQTSVIASVNPLADTVQGTIQVKAPIIIKGNVMVTKESSSGQKLSGSWFSVYTADGAYVGMMTDEGGGTYRYLDLEEGAYYVREEAAPDGYLTSTETYPFSIKENGKTVTAGPVGAGGEIGAIVNRPQTGHLRIVKQTEQDELLSLGVEGYSFRIYSEETGYDKVHSTDADGKIYLENLPVGTYIIQELLQQEAGQLGYNEPFVLPADQTVEIRANQLSRQQMTVKDEGFYVDPQLSTVVTPPGKTMVLSADIRTEQDALWCSEINHHLVSKPLALEAGEAGIGEFSGSLQAGEWQHIALIYTNHNELPLVDGGSGFQITALDGTKLGATSYEVKNLRMTLAQNGQDDLTGSIAADGIGAITNVTVQNALRRGSLVVDKVDAVTGAKLAGVSMLLEKKMYYAPSEAVPEGCETDEKGSFYWKTVGEQITDEKGTALWNGLVMGDYRLTELQAAAGYQLLARPEYFSLPMEDESQSMQLHLTIANQPIYEMPEAGGMGNRIFFALGALVILMGLIGIRKGVSPFYKKR